MPYTRKSSDSLIPLIPIEAGKLDDWEKEADPRQSRWLKSNGFKAKAGQWCAIPDSDGKIEAVVFTAGESAWKTQLATLARSLGKGKYQLISDWSREQRLLAALGWGLSQYVFDRYKSQRSSSARLFLDDDIAEDCETLCDAQNLVRDLVNTPTEDMGPGQLAEAVKAEAETFGADYSVIKGDELLRDNFPAIHVVGRAAERAPRLIQLEWGDKDQPLVALCGKGVCFDSGGLDIKSSAGMILMKKDMGGAAHVLALARLIMQHELPVRLLVLIPAVENAISGNAYRPGDVISTRMGLSVEIGNTDAEGRIVLSDALTLASEQLPDLTMDFATLTGAARVAMGPDIPPIFSNNRDVARGLMDTGESLEDPLWELPLYAPYRKIIDSEIAHINNSGKTGFGGCITAALFLQEFVDPERDWVHVDTYAWNQASSPTRPAGGDAFGLRASFEYLRRRYTQTE